MTCVGTILVPHEIQTARFNLDLVQLDAIYSCTWQVTNPILVKTSMFWRIFHIFPITSMEKAGSSHLVGARAAPQAAATPRGRGPPAPPRRRCGAPPGATPVETIWKLCLNLHDFLFCDELFDIYLLSDGIVCCLCEVFLGLFLRYLLALFFRSFASSLPGLASSALDNDLCFVICSNVYLVLINPSLLINPQLPDPILQ